LRYSFHSRSDAQTHDGEGRREKIRGGRR